jgi:uncharacterized protein (DUF2147 family)
MLKALFCAFLIFSKVIVLAQADPIEHLWYNQEKTAKIQVYKAKDGKYYGKIVWLKEPNKDGKPKVDDKNPDVDKKTQPILGLLILKGFSKDDDTHYEDGTIYDPKNGKTYSCKIARGNNKLDVRGYVGFSILGRTTTWTLAE